MERKAGYGWRKRLSPAAAAAVAAGMAGTVVSCCVLLLMRFQPALATLLVIVLPVIVATLSWLAARHAMRAALQPAMARARGHAAVARLIGVGIGRLAQGDTAARITVALPQPYEALGDDFNAAAQALQAARADAGTLRARFEKHAAALDEAVLRLGRRAQKLHARIEADLRIVAALEEHVPVEALRVARHTLQGAGVAASRNIEAAEGLAGIGLMLRQDMEGAAAVATTEEVVVPDIAA